MSLLCAATSCMLENCSCSFSLAGCAPGDGPAPPAGPCRAAQLHTQVSGHCHILQGTIMFDQPVNACCWGDPLSCAGPSGITWPLPTFPRELLSPAVVPHPALLLCAVSRVGGLDLYWLQLAKP